MTDKPQSSGVPGASQEAGQSAPARADVALVSRGLARSRAVARELIDAGRVHLDGHPLSKPSVKVGPAQRLEIQGEVDPWVGRAAYKLIAALEAFGPGGLTADGCRCLDVGASTGGFTQVLLAHGATHVTALDVGRDQLVRSVAEDPRVVELSGTNIRDVSVEGLGGAFDLVVADLSFISLRLVLPQLAPLTHEGSDVVVLVKPQFEVGRTSLGHSGVVRSPRSRADAVRGVLTAATETGFAIHGLVASPVIGGSGNQEYLLWLRREPAGMMTEMDVNAFLDQIAREKTR